jgi:hypothetical protein
MPLAKILAEAFDDKENILSNIVCLLLDDSPASDL